MFIQNKKDKGMILTEDSPRDSRFRFPNRDVSLFPHQQAMLHHCSGEIEDRHKHRCGIMNDPPGSGKTFVVMATAYTTSFRNSRHMATETDETTLSKMYAEECRARRVWTSSETTKNS